MRLLHCGPPAIPDYPMKVPADEPQSATGGIAAGDGTGTPARPTDSAAARSAHEVALAEIRRQLLAWERHEPAARLGHDPEELHQLRVAVRRIDAILSLFRLQVPVGDGARGRRAAACAARG